MTRRHRGDRLATGDSRSAGDGDTGGSAGHRSGRRIPGILRTRSADLAGADVGHKARALRDTRRRTARRPRGAGPDTLWRSRPRTRGHDPLQD